MVLPDRKPQILDVASDLLQTRGYASFSYRDISSRLGITNASVHHHFPSKDDLLTALTARYRARQKLRMAELERSHPSPSRRLEAYFELMERLASSGNKICPVGVLQSEFNVIPETSQAIVREMFDEARDWLTRLLADGRDRGELDFEGEPAEWAVTILAAVQGALQVARAVDSDHFTRVRNQIQVALGCPARTMR